MSFLSFSFLGFILLALFIYEVLPQRYKGTFLLFVSCSFYAFSGIKILLLILFSTVVFFYLAIRMQFSDENLRRRILILGILFQGLVLILSKLVVQFQPSGWGLILPLGVSYYSFKLVGYLIDVYLKKEEPEKKLTYFANYVTFFPQIVCGPIQRSREFFPQIKGLLRTNPEMVTSGMRLILSGIFKKLVVADVLGYHVDHFMDRHPDHIGMSGLVATYFIPLQVYADFSGITDIARGLGKVFGFESPQNFNQPFYASNIQEFWRRWHMTLTFWIREYIFIPLQIVTRRRGRAGLLISITITMLTIGLWHGVSWNWVAFGLIHAVYLGVSTLTLPLRNKFFLNYSFLEFPRLISSRLITFHLVLFSFIFFKLETWTDFIFVIVNIKEQFVVLFNKLQSINAIKELVWDEGFELNRYEFLRIIMSLAIMEIIHLFQNIGKLKILYFKCPVWVRWCFYLILCSLIILFGNYANLRFVYSEF